MVLLLTLWCILVTNSLFLFRWFYLLICTLSIHCRRAKKIELDMRKMFFFCHQEFTFMSKDLYMTVCSKNVLLNNWVNHINGIRLFSCTEPPQSEKRQSERDELGGRIWDYNFSVASLKNVHSTRNARNEWFTSGWLDVVTFSLNVGWNVFMEILLMMCLGKSYFL